MPENRSKHWFVAAADLSNPNGASLRRSDAEILDTDQLIPDGGTFTVSLESFYIHEAHDNDGTGNDILIRTQVRYGNEPRMDVINFFGADIPAGSVNDNLEYEHIFARQDHVSEARLWLAIEIQEIDKGLARDTSILHSFGQVYRDFGGIFATMIPFANIALPMVQRLQKLSRERLQNKLIFSSELDLYAREASAGEAPLRCGAYVFFKSEVEAVQYKLRGLKLERSAPSQLNVPILDDYVVIKVVPTLVKSTDSSDGLLQNQQVATILSQMDQGENAYESRRKEYLTYLQNVVQSSQKLDSLDYFYRLKRQQSMGMELNEAQKSRFFELADKLNRYIPL
jgi:hypothetical protein